jgi:hypothetical protein
VSAEPDGVHIDDLEAPRLSEGMREQARAMEPLAASLRFDADLLCEQARSETGLHDFGPEDFRARLALWLRSLEREGRLSALGRIARYSDALRFLKNRLLVQDQLRRHPEIREIPIERPIIVVGLPRTGTTHLHNSLAADPGLRSLPYWEALEPVPPLAEQGQSFPRDPRMARCEAALAGLNTELVHFKRMHEMTWDHVHEEIDLLAIDFSTMILETPGPLALWTEAYKRSDQTPHYRYLKTVLQVLTFLRGGRRWVLKSPQHLEQLRVVSQVFPDATFVLTHRDPVPIIASMATLWTYTARLSQERPDARAYGAYTVERIGDLLFACVRERDVLPKDQSIDVLFHELVEDQPAMMDRIYALAAETRDAERRRAADEYIRTHPQGRHGRMRYELSDFGLDARALRERFRPYTDRFAVRLEL